MGKRLPEIKQREDGRYEIKVTVGRNKRRSVYGKTETEVRKKARQLLEEAAKFNLSNISKMTVRTYMTNWLLTVKKPDLKPGSYDRVEQSVNYQILPYIGDIQISALNANDVQNMINELLVKLSYSTVKKAYNNLNACMELAVIRGEIVKNPVKGVRLPSSKNKEKKNVTAYTPEEIAAIVEEAKRTYSNGAPIYRYGYDAAKKIIYSRSPDTFDSIEKNINNDHELLELFCQAVYAEEAITQLKLLTDYSPAATMYNKTAEHCLKKRILPILRRDCPDRKIKKWTFVDVPENQIELGTIIYAIKDTYCNNSEHITNKTEYWRNIMNLIREISNNVRNPSCHSGDFVSLEKINLIADKVSILFKLTNDQLKTISSVSAVNN